MLVCFCVISVSVIYPVLVAAVYDRRQDNNLFGTATVIDRRYNFLLTEGQVQLDPMSVRLVDKFPPAKGAFLPGRFA